MVAGFARHQGAQPAGGHHLRRVRDLGANAVHQRVDHPGVTEHQARLDAGHGVGTHHGLGPRDLDPRQLGGRAVEGVRRNEQPGGDDAARVLAARRNHVQGRGRAEVDHDGALGEACVGRHRVHDAIGAQVARVFIQHRHAGLHPRSHHQRHELEVAGEQPLHGQGRGRHHRRNDGRVDPTHVQTLQLEESANEGRLLVRRALAAGFDAPVEAQGFAVEETERGVGISDVDCEEHGASRIVQWNGRTILIPRGRGVPG